MVQSTSQAQTDLTIYVYAGKNGTFSLYEDENVNYNYEKGAYSTIEFNYNDKDKTIIIANWKGKFKGMIKERNFKFILVDKSNPIGIDELKEGKMIKYSGIRTEIKL